MRIAIVGGGISGMATAYAIQEKAKESGLLADLFVIEKDERLGGKIQTEIINGWLCESGPVGYLDSKPQVGSLVASLDLNNALVRANEAAAKRYVYLDGKLQKVPMSPPAFIRSKLLSWSAKMKIARELWTKPAGGVNDETIAEFTGRHLGNEVVDKLISAMVVGVFAGDADQLSMRSAFPVMVDLEKEGSGSLIRAQLRRRKAKKAAAKAAGEKVEAQGPKSEGMVGASGTLTTFQGGMAHIISSLKERFEGEIKSGNGARRISAKDSKFAIDLDDGFELSVDAVVMAAPAYAAKKMLSDLDAELANEIGRTPYVPVNVAVFGYPADGFEHDLDGFGFVIPKKEKRDILGCLWNTSIFAGQAPDGKVSLRTMIGGALNPDAAKIDDNGTINLVQRELRVMMGVKQDPEFTHIVRHEHAIPQYVVGHAERLEKIDAGVARHAGLFLTGNAYRGVSFNDCVINAGLTAERVIDYIRDNSE